jgi:hypothetical protein
VRVLVRFRRLMLQLVVILGVLADVGRRGDVSDRRDVIPVDAVAQAKDKGSQQQADSIGFRGHLPIIGAPARAGRARHVAQSAAKPL